MVMVTSVITSAVSSVVVTIFTVIVCVCSRDNSLCRNVSCRVYSGDGPSVITLAVTYVVVMVPSVVTSSLVPPAVASVVVTVSPVKTSAVIFCGGDGLLCCKSGVNLVVL